MLPTEEVQRVQLDHVHDANITNESIYETAGMKELLLKFVQGYNVAIMSYGQTGSGKTYAFEGDQNCPGIIFRAIKDIYTNRTDKSIVSCSFVQLYNEKITDMLGMDPEKGLKMRWELDR